ncbi:hypothetical protein SS1G_01498 [Sclerotinia sclerotiorum 1980 UF-70]|uniref:RNase H type-1 domain-containing protein n=4 Tax=Sclerotinia sclerotiorum (strain ATCC 18683 / 1980 / Ss-1) TaxID=665079 RepID=A7E870_SCLS1|nr:hypothetical protein SS1G_01498 [Sclerotinia sclerotiorum 1980 UF-70]EDN96572.1 hypothetical protein SS1G_01498 [Sclerotinia sclerotiorum 1980 UF-70]
MRHISDTFSTLRIIDYKLYIGGMDFAGCALVSELETFPFNAQFLMEKKEIWDKILDAERIQIDKPWHKVIIHKIPIQEFSGLKGMDLIKEEVNTFNPGLSIMGTPYWLTNASKRAKQQDGAIVIAFATQKEADIAIQKRLYIAGISVRVERFYPSTPSSQCNRCQGFGHNESYCKKPPACGLCSNNHATVGHFFIQEPWILSNPEKDFSSTRSIAHSSFSQLLPNNPSNLRPRTMIYISKGFKPLVALAPNSPNDPDIQIIDITQGKHTIQLINIYNEADQAKEKGHTIERCLYNTPLTHHTILVGDFNSHHPWWDPFSNKSSNADLLAEWFEDHNLILFNEPGTSTFYRTNMTNPSVLDLTLATDSVSPYITDWQVLPDLGSDHLSILFEVKGTLSRTTNIAQPARFNTKLADWEKFANTLKSKISISTTLNSSEYLNIATSESNSLDSLLDKSQYIQVLDEAAKEFTRIITYSAETSIPRIKSTKRAKPWWSPELKALRKRLSNAFENAKIYPEDDMFKKIYQSARNHYFQAIKTAKKNHWNEFLEKEDTQSIFKAMSYTKDIQTERIPNIRSNPSKLENSFEGKCSAFRSTLFPPPPFTPPPNWESYKQSKKWEWPDLTESELLNACSAKIKGKTPGPDGITQDIIIQAYKAIPKAFFTLFSHLINLGYHPSCWKQATGAILKKPSKPDYSAPKAYRVIALLNCLGKISERILAQRLSYLAETTQLLHYSQMGGRQKKSAIDTAILLTTEIERNSRSKKKTSTLFLDVKGAFDHVSMNKLLDICKNLNLPTSLIAWISSFLKERLLKLSFDGQIETFKPINTGIPQDTKTASIKLPNEEIIQPSTLVRWLGIWFDPGLSFKQHVTIRATQAKTSFYRMARLANSEKGLSPKAMRQLYMACVTSIADYGSILWWKGQNQFKKILQSLQNLALRKILGVFKTSPIKPMEIEAALCPPEVRLNAGIKQYAFRLLKISPSHPVNLVATKLATEKENQDVVATPQRKQLKPTQLEKIKNSIQKDFDPLTLEGIHHFYFPPWKKEVPYKVNISKLGKEEAAMIHNLAFKYRCKNTITIYTDASSTLEGIGIGIGIAVILPNGRISHQETINIGVNQLVYNGELLGVTKAIEYANSIAQPGNKFKIYSDNQAGLFRLKTPSDLPGQSCQIKAIKAAEAIQNKGAEISLNWVPGHTSVQGNELADSLAKEATKIPSSSHETSYASIGMDIKRMKSENWITILNTNNFHQPSSTYSRNYPWKISSKIRIPGNIKRSTICALFQLKIGHGYFKSYLKRFGISSNDNCRCGGKESPDHLLLSCPLYKMARKTLNKDNPTVRPTMKYLLHTKAGIIKTLEFIEATRIATRSWHLNRMHEEEEEEGGEEGGGPEDCD